MLCSKCGTAIGTDARSCSVCGATIDVPNSSEEDQAKSTYDAPSGGPPVWPRIIGAVVGIILFAIFFAVVKSFFLLQSSPSRIQSSATAQFELVMEGMPVYQTLKEYEPEIYGGLLVSYADGIRRGYTDLQLQEQLRLQINELIRKRLPKASDEAIVTYVQLMLDQMIELQSKGGTLCFKLLYPQVSGGVDVLALFSDETKRREFDALDMTLRSYDANMAIPAKEGVLLHTEQIYFTLFDKYGEDNVLLALTNPLAPGIDKVLTCNIVRDLYAGVLQLPDKKATNALRYMFSQ